jgi:ribosome-interacting GTPase 1
MPRFPPGVHLQGGRTAAVTHAAAAREFYAQIIPVVVDLRRQGQSLRAIARELDRRGIRTRQVSTVTFLGITSEGIRWSDPEFIHWSATQVRRVLARAGALEPHKPHTDAPDKPYTDAPH